MTTKQSSFYKLIAAFAAVYLIWGSTYLAIRIAIETIPPFLMAGIRFVTAGLLLFAFARPKEKVKITAVHWRSAFIVGGLLLTGGNGGVVWAEQWVPSGITALIIATVPLWTVLLEFSGKQKPGFQTLAGITLGFSGLWYLIQPSGAGHDLPLKGIIVLMLATFSWALGSIYARRAPLPQTPFLPTAMELLGGGTLLLILGTLAGEWPRIQIETLSMRSLLALLYLIIFGALIAFTAYKYMLKHTSPTLSSTYAYVNPVIAVFLGWAFAGEPLSPRILAGAAVILAGVFLITTAKRKNFAAG